MKWEKENKWKKFSFLLSFVGLEKTNNMCTSPAPHVMSTPHHPWHRILYHTWRTCVTVTSTGSHSSHQNRYTHVGGACGLVLLGEHLTTKLVFRLDVSMTVSDSVILSLLTSWRKGLIYTVVSCVTTERDRWVSVFPHQRISFLHKRDTVVVVYFPSE